MEPWNFHRGCRSCSYEQANAAGTRLGNAPSRLAWDPVTGLLETGFRKDGSVARSDRGSSIYTAALAPGEGRSRRSERSFRVKSTLGKPHAGGGDGWRRFCQGRGAAPRLRVRALGSHAGWHCRQFCASRGTRTAELGETGPSGGDAKATWPSPPHRDGRRPNYTSFQCAV
ncbi:unnamed protein product [Lampetra planeri]